MTAMMSPTTARMASGTQDFQGTLVIGGGDTSAPGTPITSSTPAAARALLCDHMQHGQDCDCAQVVNSGNSRSGNDGYSGRSGRRISMHARLISPIEPEVCDPNAADSDGSEGPKVHDLPSTGSFLCGRDHKLCHLFIQDIHCSRQQAEIIVDDKQGKLLITRFGQNPTKVHRGKQSIPLVRYEAFELFDGDMIIFPKEHAFIVSIEANREYVVGR